MQTYPLIMLPGPIVGAHTVSITSETQDWSGRDIRKSASFQGDGSGMVQVLQNLQEDYAGWSDYHGCELLIDFGTGFPSRQILLERFGQFYAVPSAIA